MHRKIGIGILILVIIWLIVFVVRKEPETDNGVFKIGVASGLTGYAANWGTGEVNVIRLLVEEHQNDLPYIIDVIVEDTKVTGLGTVNAFKKLVDFDAVDVIIGPTWGDSFQGGYPIAEKAEIPVISPSAAFESLGDANPYPFAFSTWWPQPQEAQALVDHMKERGITAVHVLHDADAFNTKFTDIFIEHAEGGELLATRSSVPIGTNDFRTEITKLKNNEIDAIVALFQDTSSTGPLMKQLKEQQVELYVYSTTSAENQEHVEKFPGAFNGLTYSFPAYEREERYLDFVKRFEDVYGEDGTKGPAFVNTHNAMMILFEALKTQPTDGVALRDALMTVIAEGIGTENLYFNDNGQIGEVGFSMKQIQDDQFVELE